MTSLDDDFDNQFLNREHLDNAKGAHFTAPNKSPFDKFEYSDQYFKSPEDEKNRVFEKIRTLAKTAEQISTIIPDYEQTKVYHEDEDGNGQIKVLLDSVKRVTDLSGYYAHKYSLSTTSAELKSVLEPLQHKIDEFGDQVGGILKHDDPFAEITSDREPYKSYLSVDRRSSLSELKEKYGSSFTMFEDMRIWISNGQSHDLMKDVDRRVEHLKGSERRNKFNDELVEIRAALEETKQFKIENTKSFNPRMALKLLHKHNYSAQYDFTIQIDDPTLKEQIMWLNQSGKELFEGIEEYYTDKPEELCSLKFEELRSIFALVPKFESSKVINLYANFSSADQLMAFVSEDFSRIPTVNFGMIYDESAEVNEVDEKRKRVGEYFLSKSKHIEDYNISQNDVLYTALNKYFDNLSQQNLEGLKSEIQIFIGNIPDHQLLFDTNHGQQMTRYCNFITELLKPLEISDIEIESLKLLVSRLENRDTRYEYERFDKVIGKIGEIIKRKLN